MKNILVVIGLLLMFSSCEDYFEPKYTNERTYDQLLENPDMVRGLLTYAYRSIPQSFDTWGGDFLDSATDNALSNNPRGFTNRTLENDGFWSAVINPLNINNYWQARYDDLKQVNQFMEIGLDGTVIYFKGDLDVDVDYRERLKGEAYFLRAWIHFDLLRRFSGVDENGQLMGIPLITSFIDISTDELNLSRNTYAECITQIIEDLDIAISNLPDDYTGNDPNFGVDNIGRPTSVACRALKSRALLYAASPSFETSTFADAAQASSDVLDEIGTSLPNIYNLNGISNNFYNNDQNAELIMRRGQGNNNLLERINFPPGQFLLGDGQCNPSQNLVDAFPMANGYPISNGSSGYDEDLMYENRDPRFYMTIIHNNTSFRGQTVETYDGGNNMPGGFEGNVTIENSTRTGYYLRKWLSSNVSLVQGDNVNDFHYYALFRKVEAFLNLAEAANEAYGPDGGALSMTAREAIAEVRRRAGLASGGTDDYLASITSKEEMRELIKNERRIELSFEGHRFFDIRRWDDNLNEVINGITITKNVDDTFTYERKAIVTPVYKDYMNYGPIPFDEVLRTGTITQNQGW